MNDEKMSIGRKLGVAAVLIGTPAVVLGIAAIFIDKVAWAWGDLFYAVGELWVAAVRVVEVMVHLGELFLGLVITAALVYVVFVMARGAVRYAASKLKARRIKNEQRRSGDT